MSTREDSERPQKVLVAVNMLYLLLAIGIVRTGMTVIRHADVRSPYFFISVKLMIYAVTALLIYQISKGKNWARWLLLGFVSIALPLSILPTLDAFAHNPVHTLLGILQLGLYAVAMLFLFQRSSSVWFRAGRDSN